MDSAESPALGAMLRGSECLLALKVKVAVPLLLSCDMDGQELSDNSAFQGRHPVATGWDTVRGEGSYVGPTSLALASHSEALGMPLGSQAALTCSVGGGIVPNPLSGMLSLFSMSQKVMSQGFRFKFDSMAFCPSLSGHTHPDRSPSMVDYLLFYRCGYGDVL